MIETSQADNKYIFVLHDKLSKRRLRKSFFIITYKTNKKTQI